MGAHSGKDKSFAWLLPGDGGVLTIPVPAGAEPAEPGALAGRAEARAAVPRPLLPAKKVSSIDAQCLFDQGRSVMALFAVECFIQVEDAQANGGPGRKGLAIHESRTPWEPCFSQASRASG